MLVQKFIFSNRMAYIKYLSKPKTWNMLKLNKIQAKTLLKFSVILFFALFIPYLILCFFAHPAADDFTYTSASSFWGTQLDSYLHCDGRYSANFMAIANPIIYGSLTLYRLAALFLILFIPVSVFFIVSSATGKTFGISLRILISAIISLLIISLLPSLPQGIYWYTGSVTYILGCIVSMFYIGSVILYFSGKFVISRLFHLVICIILLGLSIGFNEVQMVLILVAHFFIWMSLKKGDRFHPDWLVLLAFNLLFSSIIFFAPGNYFRSSYYPTNHNFFNSLFMTLLQMPRFFFSWVSYAPLLIGSILFAPISVKLNAGSALFRKLGAYNPFVLFIMLWGILFICIFPPYWSTAILGQHRTLNTACFFFVPAWFIFLHSVYSRNSLSDKLTPIINRPVQTGLVLLLGCTLLFSGNSGAVLMDFATGKITAFNKEMNTRNRMLEAAKKQGLKEAAVPLIQNRPGSLFVLDIEPGCNYWVNQEYAHFFGLEKVCSDSAGNASCR